MKSVWLATLVLLAAPAQARSPLSPGAHRFSVGGVSQWYRVAGKTEGIPVVFLHGGPAEGSQGFARTIGPAMERRLRMIYFDQRGAGHSDRPADGSAYSLAGLVEDLEALRKTLGVRRIALIGHSYGSTIALEYAAKYPRSVSRLVLVSAVPDQRAALNLECRRLRVEQPEIYKRAKAAADRPGDADCIPVAGFEGKAAGKYYREIGGDSAGTMARLQAADRTEGVTISGPAHLALGDPFSQYLFSRPRAIHAPTLAIVGARDRIAPLAPVAALVAAMPRARVITYLDAGHFLFVEQPDRFARDVSQFLYEGPDTPAAR